MNTMSQILYQMMKDRAVSKNDMGLILMDPAFLGETEISQRTLILSFINVLCSIIPLFMKPSI